MRSRTLVLTAVSYVLNWAVVSNATVNVVRGFGIGGGILCNIGGFRRLFSLADRSIAYPR